MDEREWLAEKFEGNRAHLRAVAYRMLGSLNEADDAVQEAWLRLNRADTSGVENLGGWLTTVVARVCLDMLRSRKSRREESLDTVAPDPVIGAAKRTGPEQEALLADSIGLALLVVLQTLPPPERVAFVLHDMFDLPFDEIAAIVGRSPTAARQLASRARRRVRGAARVPDAEISRQRHVVDAFLAALRGGDFEALVAVLDPDVVVRSDAAVSGTPREIRGAKTWASQAVVFGRMARSLQSALVDGSVGVILAPRGRLLRALNVTINEGKIVQLEIIGDPARLEQLDLAVLD
jgi:RNA polymerase sigma-70 factor, ECF subfamily